MLSIRQNRIMWRALSLEMDLTRPCLIYDGQYIDKQYQAAFVVFMEKTHTGKRQYGSVTGLPQWVKQHLNGGNNRSAIVMGYSKLYGYVVMVMDNNRPAPISSKQPAPMAAVNSVSIKTENEEGVSDLAKSFIDDVKQGTTKKKFLEMMTSLKEEAIEKHTIGEGKMQTEDDHQVITDGWKLIKSFWPHADKSKPTMYFDGYFYDSNNKSAAIIYSTAKIPSAREPHTISNTLQKVRSFAQSKDDNYAGLIFGYSMTKGFYVIDFSKYLNKPITIIQDNFVNSLFKILNKTEPLAAAESPERQLAKFLLGSYKPRYIDLMHAIKEDAIAHFEQSESVQIPTKKMLTMVTEGDVHILNDMNDKLVFEAYEDAAESVNRFYNNRISANKERHIEMSPSHVPQEEFDETWNTLRCQGFVVDLNRELIGMVFCGKATTGAGVPVSPRPFVSPNLLGSGGSNIKLRGGVSTNNQISLLMGMGRGKFKSWARISDAQGKVLTLLTSPREGYMYILMKVIQWSSTYKANREVARTINETCKTLKKYNVALSSPFNRFWEILNGFKDPEWLSLFAQESKLHVNHKVLSKIIVESIKAVLNEATGAWVGMLLPDGRVKSASVHFDGYIGGVGKMLKQHWNNAKDIDRLLDNGNMEVLGKDIGVQHDPQDRSTQEMTTFYIRDHGNNKPYEKAEIHQNPYAYAWEAGHLHWPYAYLFDPKTHKWFLKTGLPEPDKSNSLEDGWQPL